jgi:hypothetical protein
VRAVICSSIAVGGKHDLAVDIRDDHLVNLVQLMNSIRGSDVSRVYIWESAMSMCITYLFVVEANASGDDLGGGAESRRHYLAVDTRDNHLGRLFQLMNFIRGSDVSRAYIWESAVSWLITYIVIIEADPFSEDLGSGAVCVGQHGVRNRAGAAGRDGN